MSMTHRERLETAWRHEEPDRVPIEMRIPDRVREHPADRMDELTPRVWAAATKSAATES